MSTEGMSDADFFLELELYDVIRPPTWQSWNLSAANHIAQSALPPASSSAKPVVTNFIPRLDPEASFWKNLEVYASSKYEPDDAEILIDVLQDSLDEKIEELSLDELERLAASIKAYTH